MAEAATLTRIELPPQTRYLTLPVIEGSAAIVDADTREVSFAFSSESPVKRIDWDIWEYIWEVLSHDPAHANLDRCNSGAAPLLWNHNRDDQRGIVTKAWIDSAERRAWCTVRFSRSTRADQLLQDVNDRIVQNVSFCYLVHELELTKISDDDYNTYTSNDWEVVEVSLVSIPADPSVGIGRTQDSKNPVIVRGLPTLGTTGEPMPAEPASPSLEELQRQLADQQRQNEELRQQQQQAQRQQTIRDRFSQLKDQARTLLDQRKLSTAAYESMFSDSALKRYLEEHNTELDGVQFHLKQIEQYASAPASFGPSAVGDVPLPDHPNQRQENGGARPVDEATAARLAQKAGGGPKTI